MKNSAFIIFILFFFLSFKAQPQSSPHGLTVNLLSNPEQVYINGYPAIVELEKAIALKENFQFTEISTNQPSFGWIMPSQNNNTLQSAYRILVASNRSILQRDSADMWDSGKTYNDCSVNIQYNGQPLSPNHVYFWKIQTWDRQGTASDFSKISAFKTANKLTEYATDRHPLRKQDEFPVKIQKIDPSRNMADFGKASFGRLRVNLFSDKENENITIHLGEALKDGAVNRSPGGSIRYAQYNLQLKKGWNTYLLTVQPDKRNTGPQAVLIPQYIGEVIPFRYCEIENYNHPIQERDLIRESVYYPFNDFESHFHSTDTILNQVWDISKYSIKATSFAGVYVDGDRERIPYEADALINQLAHYSVARDFSMARYTHEYLIHRPTWPTEWHLQSVLIAWEDYMYTGNKQSLAHFYDDLKAKTLIALAEKDGLISTRTEKVTPEVLQSIHFKGELRDIVDWPHTGILGLEKEEGGEADGFVFTNINTVVNAFHYRAVVLMAQIAETLGNTEDKVFFSDRAKTLKESFNKHLFDKKRGIYTDGIDTDHASLHSNMFALAFGLVPKESIDDVLTFIRSRGMACSVYGSQFLLDAIYDYGDADYALQLLTSKGDRSWYNMIRSGSTITLEAWDSKYKPNLDWSHAWGAAPANLIPRKLMGIEPMLPGFKKIRIKPQPHTLQAAEIKIPTIRGDVSASFDNSFGKSFILEVEIPANTTAEIYLPFYSRKQQVQINGKTTKFRREGNFSVIENIGSGKWSLSVKQ